MLTHIGGLIAPLATSHETPEQLLVWDFSPTGRNPLRFRS